MKMPFWYQDEVAEVIRHRIFLQQSRHGVVWLSTRPLGYKGAWASAHSVAIPWSYLKLDVTGERLIFTQPLESSQASPVYSKAAGIVN